jgi:DNA-binding MarR family transcriptional regulator
MASKTPLGQLTPEGELEEGGIQDLLGYQLAQATIVTSSAFASVAGAAFELREVEFTILHLLSRNKQATATHLAKALAMTQPGVAIWLERLEQRELIRRETSASDRRAQQIRLTRKGSDLVRQALERLLAADRELLAGFTEGERRILLELLHRVAQVRKRPGA